MAAPSRRGYSRETTELLSKMMAESKLTAQQQKVLHDSLRAGRALPAAGPPPSAYRRERAPRAPAPTGPWEDRYRGVALNPTTTHGMGRKPQAAIVSDARGYARDAFSGGGDRVVDRERQKDELADLFAFGARAPDHAGGAVAARRGSSSCAAKAFAAPPPARAPARTEAHALHEAISAEIDERNAFVADMRALGRREHEATVRAEVAQRMADLRRLEVLMDEPPPPTQ
ncbi:hypothetical protein KFE25_005210 [Diacronema lutheri]|uniref:Uncharacterized protein n=1 Tax=Diacronema lutheri TaxID=2081491 RepID=A0A8J6C8U2_DIALT|nr:hypothetical protein KFE25_005210 [Diacronema lutheri]